MTDWWSWSLFFSWVEIMMKLLLLPPYLLDAFWQNVSLACPYALGRKPYALFFLREFVSKMLSVKPLGLFSIPHDGALQRSSPLS